MPKKQKRSDGRYLVQLYLGRDENGKRKLKNVYGKTQKEANEAAEALRLQLGKGMDITESQNSFQKWSLLFLETQKNKLSESEYKTKKSRIEFFYPFFGSYPINRIQPYQVDEALTSLAKENPVTGKPSAKKTLIGYKQACSQVFRIAIKNRAIDFNPVEHTEAEATPEPKERRALTASERERIINSDHKSKTAAMIAMFAGLRRGELTALTWDDIDFTANTINVNKSYDFKSRTDKPPKTKSGYRKVPMPKILAEHLSTVEHTNKYVCSLNGRKMTNQSDWESLLYGLLVDLEIKYGTSGRKRRNEKTPTVFTIPLFGWHDLRHTYATILYEADVDKLTAKELLGHADISTTIKIYTHLSEQQKTLSIDKLDTFLSGNNKAQLNQSYVSQLNSETIDNQQFQNI